MLSRDGEWTRDPIRQSARIPGAQKVAVSRRRRIRHHDRRAGTPAVSIAAALPLRGNAPLEVKLGFNLPRRIVIWLIEFAALYFCWIAVDWLRANLA
jgi:hypothetical protein